MIGSGKEGEWDSMEVRGGMYGGDSAILHIDDYEAGFDNGNCGMDIIKMVTK